MAVCLFKYFWPSATPWHQRVKVNTTVSLLMKNIINVVVRNLSFTLEIPYSEFDNNYLIIIIIIIFLIIIFSLWNGCNRSGHLPVVNEVDLLSLLLTLNKFPPRYTVSLVNFEQLNGNDNNDGNRHDEDVDSTDFATTWKKRAEGQSQGSRKTNTLV